MGDHVVLPSPRKGSCVWAAGPERQPLSFTRHKHKQALFRLTAFTLQAASFCVCLHAWVKGLCVSSRDSTFKRRSYFSRGEVYGELECATANKKTYPSFCPSLSVTTL